MKWLPWLIFALFSFYLVGHNFSAKLGMIDDHEIALFLGGDGKIDITEVPKVIMSTEVGQWGTYLRYRPSYYTLRVIETAIWRDNAQLWYLSRYLMLVVSMWLGWKILSRYFPKVVSYLFVFYVMTMPFWPDLLTRLGPSEIYTLPAILLFVYGCVKNKLWMIALGYMICVGAKENFLVLFPVLLTWVGYQGITKKLTRKELLVILILLIYTVFITGAILVATAKVGADIYGNQISYRYRITKFAWELPSIIRNRQLLPSLVVISGGIIASFMLFFRRGWKACLESPITSHTFLAISLLCFIATQYIFYSNQLPTNMRYDFPGMILFPIVSLTALRLVVVSTRRHVLAPISAVAYVFLACLYLFFIFHRGYTRIQLQAENNAKVTQVFHARLGQAEKVISTHRASSIVFVSRRYIDFEAIVSVSRYLQSMGVSNPISLYFTPQEKMNDPLGNELQGRLIRVMHGESSNDHLFDHFSAYSPSASQLCVTFDEAKPLPDCPVIATF